MLEKRIFLNPKPALHTRNQAQLTGAWDLIFSNAALHWSENQAELMPALYKKLSQADSSRYKIPSNHNHISHQIYRETANEEMFKIYFEWFAKDMRPCYPLMIMPASFSIAAQIETLLSLKKSTCMYWKMPTQS